MDEGDAISMASQLSNRLWSVFPQSSSVPHLAQCVVTAGEEQLRRAVGEGHSIHVVLVGVNLTRRGVKKGVQVSNSLSMCA